MILLGITEMCCLTVCGSSLSAHLNRKPLNIKRLRFFVYLISPPFPHNVKKEIVLILIQLLN